MKAMLPAVRGSYFKRWPQLRFARFGACALAALIVALRCWAAPPPATPAGAVYPAPTNGWIYIYDGDKDTAAPDGSGFASLDGTWSHDNDSDKWDGSKIGGTLADGVNAPGGVMTITEDGATFLRMQDPGNPTVGNFFSDPSNRKVYLGHDITSGGGSDNVMDDGVTLTFRARIPTPTNTKGPIDPLYPADGTGPTPYPVGGDGFLNGAGKGNFGIKQRAGGIISFSLTVPTDKYDESDPSSPAVQFSGLTMNKLNGNTVTGDVDFPSPGEFRGVALDPTQWHEFWITIKADSTGVGTHEVGIYMDGSMTGTNMIVTAGNGDDYLGLSYLAMGGSLSVQSYALDADFFAYKLGAEPPTGGTQRPQFTSIVANSGNVVITWTGGGTLQQSTALGTGWAELPGTTSPTTNNITGQVKFYRIKL